MEKRHEKKTGRKRGERINSSANLVKSWTENKTTVFLGLNCLKTLAD